MMSKHKELWRNTYNNLLLEAEDDGMSEEEAEEYAMKHVDSDVQDYLDAQGDYLYEQWKDTMRGL